MNIVLIILLVIVFIVAVVTTVKNIIDSAIERAEKRRLMEQEGIILFGYLMTTDDFISVVQTLASYLMAADDNELDLHDFINDDLMRRKDLNDNCLLIERAINELPIVACKHMGHGRFIIDQERLIEKYEDYQKVTQKDDYIIPMFQVDVVSRNPLLFNFPTRFQQTETLKKILHSELLRYMFQLSDKVISNGEKLSEESLKESIEYRMYAPLKKKKRKKKVEVKNEEKDDKDPVVDYIENLVNPEVEKWMYENCYPGQITVEEYLATL